MARLISFLGASVEEFLKNRSLLNAFQMRIAILELLELPSKKPECSGLLSRSQGMQCKLKFFTNGIFLPGKRHQKCHMYKIK